MEDGFYMVFKEDGRTPTYKHPTLDAAKKEAERLVRLYGGKCYILGAMSAVEKTPEFQHTQCETGNLDIPF